MPPNQREAKIPNTIDRAFSGCSNLTSITIPASVTSIGSGAFSGCSNLTSITIPASVTSIGNGAFTNCSGLQTVNLNARNCTYAGDEKYPIFKGCTSLTTANIGADVGIIPDYTFYNCSGLARINVNSDNTAYSSQDGILYNHAKTEFVYIPQAIKGTIAIPDGITSIGEKMFYGRKGLTSITIPAGVTPIGNGAFTNCYKLIEVCNNSEMPIVAGNSIYGDVAYYAKNVYSSNGSSSKLAKHDEYIFYEDGSKDEYYLVSYTGGQTEISLPEIGRNYLIYKYAFYHCGEIKTITIPQSITAIDDYAFDECANLQTVKWNATNCTRGGFSGCTSLTTVNIGANVQTIPDYAFYDCSNLTSITIPASVTSIGSSAFYGCSFTSITIPASVTSIGSGAFGYCTNLQTVNWNATNCTNAGGWDPIFSNCTSLTTVNIGENVQIIPDYAFCNCKVTSITIPASVTSIGSGAFSGCSNLTSITIPASVTSIGNGAFDGCANLQPSTTEDNAKYLGNSENPYLYLWEVTDKSITNFTIKEEIKIIGSYAFENCTNLHTVSWNAIKCVEVGTGAFTGCASLATVNIGANVQSIPYHTFSSDSSFEKIDVAPDNTTYSSQDGILYNYDKTEIIRVPGGKQSVTIIASVTSIGNWAFENCSCLVEIEIPDSVISIGYGAFQGCTNLRTVTFKNPSGWKVSKNRDMRDAFNISSYDLKNQSTAAQYLREYIGGGSYSNYYWKRSQLQ